MKKIFFVEEGSGEYPDFQAFRDMHPSAYVLSVDGKDCIGICESCGNPVVVGDKYQQWEDVITCEKCSECQPEQLLTAAA